MPEGNENHAFYICQRDRFGRGNAGYGAIRRAGWIPH